MSNKHEIDPASSKMILDIIDDYLDIVDAIIYHEKTENQKT